jgi:hypothetical protein
MMGWRGVKSDRKVCLDSPSLNNFVSMEMKTVVCRRKKKGKEDLDFVVITANCFCVFPVGAIQIAKEWVGEE